MKFKFNNFIFVLLVASSVSVFAIAISYFKIFQSLEWLAYDAWFRFRSTEAKEKRISEYVSISCGVASTSISLVYSPEELVSSCAKLIG